MKKLFLASAMAALLTTAVAQPRAEAGLIDWFIRFIGFDSNKPGRFQVWQSKQNGQWYFRLLAANNKIILASEGYRDRAGAENGIRSLIANSAGAYTEFRQATNGKWYFVWRAANYQVTGNSQMYKDKDGAEGGMEAVRRVLSNKPAIQYVK